MLQYMLQYMSGLVGAYVWAVTHGFLPALIGIAAVVFLVGVLSGRPLHWRKTVALSSLAATVTWPAAFLLAQAAIDPNRASFMMQSVSYWVLSLGLVTLVMAPLAFVQVLLTLAFMKKGVQPRWHLVTLSTFVGLALNLAFSDAFLASNWHSP